MLAFIKLVELLWIVVPDAILCHLLMYVLLTILIGMQGCGKVYEALEVGTLPSKCCSGRLPDCLHNLLVIAFVYPMLMIYVHSVQSTAVQECLGENDRDWRKCQAGEIRLYCEILQKMP